MNSVSMLWVKGNLPAYATASIQSYLKLGYQVHLYTYDRDLIAPSGCLSFDARDVLPEDDIFEYQQGSQFKGYLSGFANWFRYELLFEKGGLWSDLDVICIKEFQCDQRFAFASGWEPNIPKAVNNNVIFAADKGEEIFGSAAAACRVRGQMIAHAETGPVLLSELVHQFGLQKYVVRPGLFNPISYSDIHRVLRSRKYIVTLSVYRKIRNRRPIFLNSTTCGVHLFAGLLRKHADITTASSIPKNSYLAHLFRQAGVRG